MAITIQTDIPDYAPIYNKMETAVTSTNVALPGFKFIFDIVTESNGTFRTKVNPEPDAQLGIQDVSQIIEEFVKEKISPFNVATAFVQGSDPMIIKYHIEYGEQYDVAGVPTEFPNLTTGTDKHAWSGAFPTHEWIDEVINPNPFNTWLSNTVNGTSAEFLTRLKTHTVSIEDWGRTHLMTDAPTDVDYLEVKTFDSAGALISTFQINNVENMTITPSRVLSVATGPDSLNAIPNGQFALGVQPVITAAVASYTVQAFESTPTAISEILTFEIEEPCRYAPVRLHWVNELGGIDAFNFTLRNKESQDSEKKKYTRSKTEASGSGLVYKHENNGTVAYYVQTRDKIQVRSDYLTTELNQYLKELISSPQVYLEFTDKSGAQNFKQVFVNTARWSDNSNEFEKLVRIDLDIDLANINIRQRR